MIRGAKAGSSPPPRSFWTALLAFTVLTSFSPKVSALPPSSGAGSALTELAQQLDRLSVSEPHLVAIGPLEVPQAQVLLPEASNAFHQKILASVAPGLKLATQRLKEPLSASEAGVQARRLGLTLVHLSPEIRGGNLELRARVISWPRSFWQRARNPGGIVTQEVLFRVPADSTVRSLFPRGKTPTLTMKIKSPLDKPLALACGTLGDEGERAVVLVNRRAVNVAALEAGKFTRIREKTWEQLSDISGAPLRTPLASTRIDQEGIWVSLSDRKDTLVLGPELQKKRSFGRALVLGQGQCAPFSTTGIDLRFRPCEGTGKTNEPDPRLTESESAWALTQARLTEGDGTQTQVEAVLSSAGGPLEISVTSVAGGTSSFKIKDVGSAIALSDLDGDGNLELISSTTADEHSDAVVISTLTKTGHRVLSRTKAPGVSALSVCPFTGRNPLTLLAAVNDEIWIFQ